MRVQGQTARGVLDAAMSEAVLQRSVMAHLKTFGWKWYHTRYSMGSNAGFPDLVAVKGERVLFIELKRQDGVLSPTQREWADALSVGFCHEYWLWRPSDLSSGLIERVLRGLPDDCRCPQGYPRQNKGIWRHTGSCPLFDSKVLSGGTTQ